MTGNGLNMFESLFKKKSEKSGRLGMVYDIVLTTLFHI